MTPYRLRFLPKAEKQLAAIRDRRLRLPLERAIQTLAEEPRPAGCIKLVGYVDEWRIRVGDWRVIYRIDDGMLVVLVVTLGPRGEVYRGV